MTEGGTHLACPRCHEALGAEILGPIAPHRCARCGGLWLDPPSFRSVCDVETRASPRALALREQSAPGAPPPEDRVRYLPCPACGQPMNRVNFARVSGVIVDVCRPHGAWLEAGELQAIRRFVRGPGLSRYLRRRALDEERNGRLGAASPSPPPAGGGGIDLLDILAGIPDRFDVPGPRTWRSQLLRGLLLAAAGGPLVWWALLRDDGGYRGSDAALVLGGFLLLASLRAFADAAGRYRAG